MESSISVSVPGKIALSFVLAIIIIWREDVVVLFYTHNVSARKVQFTDLDS